MMNLKIDKKIQSSNMESNAVSLSLCICTMNRPKELERCLESIFQSSNIPDEVIVSDDSHDPLPNQIVVKKYSSVKYQIGPKQGLGSNRNACIRRVTGSHVIFIDDDVLVPSEFFTLAKQVIASQSPQVIITGYEMNYGRDKHKQSQEKVRKVCPHNTDFWGIQRLSIEQKCSSIVINATIFPFSLFEQALFDENLRYGSDEIDISHHAISLGYKIIYQDCLYVNHYPSSVNREYYQHFIHASRLYATTKSYWQYEKSLYKTLAYVLLAPLQLVGSQTKRNGLVGVWKAIKATMTAVKYSLAKPSKSIQIRSKKTN